MPTICHVNYVMHFRMYIIVSQTFTFLKKVKKYLVEETVYSFMNFLVINYTYLHIIFLIALHIVILVL